jgi:hypothetical protein
MANDADYTIRFDGRTLQFTVLVNTDEEIEIVAERIRRAASGPGIRMAAVGGNEADVDTARPFWDALRRAAPHSIPIDAEGKPRKDEMH